MVFLSVIGFCFVFCFAAVCILREANMVCLDFFLWAIICHVSALPTVETCAILLSSIHFCLARLLVLSEVLSFGWRFSFAFVLIYGGGSAVLLLGFLGSVACVLVSATAFVGSCLVHSGIVSFS